MPINTKITKKRSNFLPKLKETHCSRLSMGLIRASVRAVSDEIEALLSILSACNNKKTKLPQNIHTLMQYPKCSQ